MFLLGTGTKLTDVTGAAEHLLRDPACGLALVGAQEQEPFLSLMKAARFAPSEVDQISGLNYSTGKRLDLTLYGAPRAG